MTRARGISEHEKEIGGFGVFQRVEGPGFEQFPSQGGLPASAIAVPLGLTYHECGSHRGNWVTVRFSRHARRQMKWRRVAEDEVLKVLEAPDRVEESIENRANAYRVLGRRFLKVTYKRDGADMVVVTVIEKENTGRQR